MRKAFLTRMAVCQYLKDKLPDGWTAYGPPEYVYTDEFFDSYILLTKRIGPGGRHIGIPVIVGNPDSTAQECLHAAWGTHEQGYEIWR